MQLLTSKRGAVDAQKAVWINSGDGRSTAVVLFLFAKCGTAYQAIQTLAHGDPGRYGRSLCLGTNPSKNKGAGVPEKIGADFVLLEIRQKNAVDNRRRNYLSDLSARSSRR